MEATLQAKVQCISNLENDVQENNNTMRTDRFLIQEKVDIIEENKRTMARLIQRMDENA